METHDILYDRTDRNPDAALCKCGRFRMQRQTGENSLHFYTRARQAFERHMQAELTPPPGPIGVNQRTAG